NNATRYLTGVEKMDSSHITVAVNYSPDTYAQEQLKAIQSWKDSPPSIFTRAVGNASKPLAWVIKQITPPSAIEGALRGFDWLAQQTIVEERVLRKAGVNSFEDLKRLHLRDLDVVADSFHRSAVVYGVAEGATAGYFGLPVIPVDISAVV